MKTRHGWIRSIRGSKKIAFIAATDGSEEFQLTVKKDVSVEGTPKIGASFTATGEDSTTPRGSYEFLVFELKIIGDADDSFPIQPKEHSDEFLRSIPESRGRAAKTQAIWRLRHFISQYIHQYFTHYGFIQYYAPILTSADCEGAGETFKVSSDWLASHLTVSAQLHGEVGMMSCGKIYTFGPCFRAEKSTGRRHLSEFWMIEPEMAFYDLEKTICLTEHMIKHVIQRTAILHGTEFEKMRIDKKHLSTVLTEEPWVRLSYKETAEKYGIVYGQDLGAEVERKLIRDHGKPVFVTHWPKSLKPFYMKSAGNVVECFDLIFPEVGELVGGSVREEDYETLEKQIEESGLKPESMDWYLQTRQWGTVPHAGFGLGLERLVMFLCKLEKVYDAIPFPVHY
jgi:asparaginyl-tRNA synthetase